MLPCQHCKLNQELNTLKQRKNTLNNCSAKEKKTLKWRTKWDDLKRDVSKKEKELKKLAKTPHNCEENWDATTPINNQPFTFGEPKLFTFSNLEKDFSNIGLEVPKFTEPKSSSNNQEPENDTLLQLIQETNKNTKLELEIQQLQIQLGKQFSTIKIFESNWKKLEQAFDNLATENNQLETENKKLLRELDNFRTKNKQLEDELDFIQQELLLKDGEVGLLERQKGKLEKHNHKLANQREILQQDYQATIRKFIAMRAADKANNRMTERERERERETKLLRKLALYQVCTKLLKRNIALLTNERDNWQSSSRIANDKLKQAEQKLEKLQLDYEKERYSHQLTLSSLISINKKQQNLRHENDRLRDELTQKEKQLNLFKLWFPNQTPPAIAQSYQYLDNKVQAIKKQAAKWKKAYQQEQQQVANLQQQINNHNCLCPNICCANGDYNEVKQQRDNYRQQLDNHTCPTTDNSELVRLREEVKEKAQKIAKLENEIKILKDKPPVVDNSEVERLLTVIEEKEQIIKELEVKLAKTEPQIIKVESEEVQELRNKLVQQEKRITRLHVIYLLILSMATVIGLVSLIRSKISKKKAR